MKKIHTVAIGVPALLLAGTSLFAHRGVSEISEGTVQKVYIDKPLIGAKGYVVGDWHKGDVRVEVKNFPRSEIGYEVFLFEINAKAYMSKMFVDGNPDKGIVASPPPFGEVAGLITQWYSVGDLKVDEMGNGTLEHRKEVDLYKKGLNMIFVFEKVTAGQHEGPEDTSRLMVECNGPLSRTRGSEGMEGGIKSFPSRRK